jgi:CarD family transcriptional regulator
VGFKVGQKVVYPNHGIGIIERIALKNIGAPAYKVNTRVASIAKSLDDSIEVLLEQMEPESAKRLKLCAIPHYISPDIVQVLEPTLSTDQAMERYTELSTFSFITLNEDGLLMHEDVRHYLFSRWITPFITPEFINVSARLVEYFERSAKEARGVKLQAAQRQILFHMLGTNLKRNFNKFERLLKEMRNDNQFSECESLIKLVLQYEGMLEPEYVIRLMIYEGDLAVAQGQWELAKKIFAQMQAGNLLELKREHIINDYLRMIAAKEYKGDFSLVVKLLKESNEVGTTSLPFYEIRLADTNSVVLVPVANASEVGLRSPISSGECEMLLKNLSDDFTSPAHDWKDRFKDFSEKMRTGDIFEVADVLKNLTFLSHNKPLSFREQRILERARHLVISEIAAVVRQPEGNVASRIEQALARACAKHERKPSINKDIQWHQRSGH